MKTLQPQRIYLSLIALFYVYSVTAQKLPNVQKISLRAPINVKADGKVLEWGQFQAYNHSTDTYYTIANSDDNLYVTIQAKDILITKKIIAGGITFSINYDDQVNKHQYIVINSPKLKEGSQSKIASYLGDAQRYRDNKMGNVDSVIMLANNEVSANAKEMIVRDAKSLPDTISVYNEFGLKGIMLFDHDCNLNYELVIPLKYLGLSINTNSKFSYKVILKGFMANMIKVDNPNIVGIVNIPRGLYNGNSVNPGLQTMSYQTDFGGEYTLK
ncbi:MAG: hypothetical protein ACXVAY_06815 [Mucilaginibacter sp.]